MNQGLKIGHITTPRNLLGMVLLGEFLCHLSGGKWHMLSIAATHGLMLLSFVYPPTI